MQKAGDKVSEYSDLIEKAREISTQTSFRAEALQTGFSIMLLQELQKLNDNLSKLVEYTIVRSASNREKTDAVKVVEQQLGASIEKLLSDREGRSLSEIADEFDIAKSTVYEWRKKYLQEAQNVKREK